jgi:hypothetical protein
MSERAGMDLGDILARFGRPAIAGALEQQTGMHIYEASLTGVKGALLGLGRTAGDKRLILTSAGSGLEILAAFAGTEAPVQVYGFSVRIKTCPLCHANAAGLRRTVAWTAPSLQGVKKAVGLGDRLGLATPGHVRAVRDTGVVPFFAQQSIREMTRTERTPEDVMDRATWGVFETGYGEGFGADADHLKTAADADRCVPVRFTMYTIDPSDHVDDAASSLQGSALEDRYQALPWAQLEDTATDARSRYLGRQWSLPDDSTLAFTEEGFLHAAVKYGRAVGHTVGLYRHLCRRLGEGRFELEMSVDETSQPTTPEEHFYIASELKRLAVRWVGLAPRFVGDFEKGVDYKGDLAHFRATFAQHVAIARHFGGYKLSIHSGSDKFAIYPIVAELAGDLVHLKTAGTSYLEALRALARIEPGLFREILAFAFERYAQDKASYHVSADVAKVPRPGDLADGDLAGVLDLFDGRQLLHVTFGSVLTARDEGGRYRFRDRLLASLRANEEAYYAALAEHLGKHIAPFATA